MADISKITLPSGETYNIDAVTVEGHTVKTNVPADAVFTDTKDLNNMTGILPVNKGGTGGESAAAARTNLGLGAAAVKDVDTLITKGSSSANIPTTAAIAGFVERQMPKNSDISVDQNILVVQAGDSEDPDIEDLQTELTDIRVGADGTVYPTAGDAVRGQISDLKEDLKQTVNLTIERTGNDFVWESGTFSATGADVANSARARTTKLIPCMYYKSITGSETVDFVVGVFDSGGNILGYYNGSSIVSGGVWMDSADLAPIQDKQIRIAIRLKAAPTSDIAPSAGNTNISFVSALRSDIEGLISNIAEIDDELFNTFQISRGIATTLTSDQFINATNGNISSSSGFSMTAPIPVKKGQKVTLSAVGYSTVTGMIATCNEDNTSRTVVVVSNGGGLQNYVYDVTEDGYIVCSFYGTNYTLSLSLDYYSLFSDVNLLDPIHVGTESVQIIAESTGFINASNSKYSTSSNFKVSKSIRLYKGQTVNLQAAGYLTNVGMINLYDSDNDTYQTVVASIDSTYRTYTYTATKDCDVRFSYSSSSTPNATITTTENVLVRINNIEQTVEDLQGGENYPVEYPQMFTNVICIGDSLTYGHDGQTRLDTNYPFYLSKLADVTVSNQGLTGRTTKEWWDEIGSTYSDFTNFDCAIIYLGTNGGLTDTVSTDCNASDYTQNADTNTGCYGKIIGKIKADAPNCKIFCVGGPAEYVRRTYNPIIEQIANLYNVAYLDMTDCILSDDGSTSSIQRQQYRPYDGIHYNRLGYFTFANMVYDYMKNYMENHLSKYVS